MSQTLDRTPAPHRARKPVLYTFGGITLLGIVVFALSWQYPMLTGHQIGPGFLPRLAAAGMTVMGVLLLMDELRGGSVLVGDGAVVEGADQTPAELKATHRKLIWVGVLTLAACIGVWLLGLLPSLTILAFLLSAFVEKMTKPVSAMIAAATFAMMYLIFVVILNVQMPFGIFDAAFWGLP
jgi:hypothetical protein